MGKLVIRWIFTNLKYSFYAWTFGSVFDRCCRRPADFLLYPEIRTFQPTTLRGTLAAIVGGDAIAFLLTMHDRFSVADFHLWYFMGIGVSFFFYAVYILVINILFNQKNVRTVYLCRWNSYTASETYRGLGGWVRISVDALVAAWDERWSIYRSPGTFVPDGWRLPFLPFLRTVWRCCYRLIRRKRPGTLSENL